MQGQGASRYALPMHALLFAAALLLADAAPATPAVSAEPAVGDRAPDFTLPNPQGGTFHLADLAGKKMAVLVFYPRAFSGG